MSKPSMAPTITKNSELFYKENQNIIEIMKSLGLEPIGTIIQPTDADIFQTFKALNAIIAEKNQSAKEKNSFNSLVQELNSTIEQDKAEIESKQKELSKVKKEIDSAKEAYSNLSEKYQEETKRLKAELLESSKINKQLNTKINAHIHDIRKKEKETTEVKEKFQKFNSEKITFKNNIEITKQLSASKQPSCNESSEFALVVCSSLGTKMKYIEKENSLLKQALNKVNEDIAEVYEARKKSIIMLDPTFGDNTEPIEKISPQLLNSYFEKSKERIGQIIFKNSELLKSLSSKIDSKISQMGSSNNEATKPNQHSTNFNEILQQVKDTISQFKQLNINSNSSKAIHGDAQPFKGAEDVFHISEEEIQNYSERLKKSTLQIEEIKAESAKAKKESDETILLFKQDQIKIEEHKQALEKQKEEVTKFVASVENAINCPPKSKH